ncbi:putative CDP-alcohol phosphatidyltransferase class-I family protein [Porphyridium purpureum]|uniref:Putative CDP-alcohol phosphatidyltransferase class-I family protein n=1 Tax=Porphyridium purpureum TaxID=35688 RepID=A0A5J4Z0S9_PORPP|nr:putative CDP-alcohol phosphatidyltransferase class-I family protein [Porphyridium purpureum]|eukprot:POR3005..scf208_2
MMRSYMLRKAAPDQLLCGPFGRFQRDHAVGISLGITGRLRRSSSEAHAPKLSGPRESSALVTGQVPAFAFDIDGVLQRGGSKLAAGIEAMRALHDSETGLPRVPLVFLTNGGGHTEHARAQKLSRMFDIQVREEQIILSHTPMRNLAPKYNALKDKSVLCVGRRECARVAAYYGFERPISSEDLGFMYQSSTPLSQYDEQKRRINSEQGIIGNDDAFAHVFAPEYLRETANLGVASIFVMHDSADWGRDIQLISDIVLTEESLPSRLVDPSVPVTPLLGEQRVDVYFSNPDFIWPNEVQHPRYGQGAFRIALCAVYRELTRRELVYEQFGKPQAIQYREVTRRLTHQLCRGQTISHIYAIGDNPAADVRGANGAGKEFVSVLVRTGCFQGDDENDSNDPAHIVVPDALHAVREALRRELGTDSLS